MSKPDPTPPSDANLGTHLILFITGVVMILLATGLTKTDVSLILIVAGAIPANLFPIFYGFRAPWWRSLLGRALITKATGLALLVDFSLLFSIFGDYTYRDEARVVVYTIIVAGLWLQFIALLRTQRRKRIGRETVDAGETN